MFTSEGLNASSKQIPNSDLGMEVLEVLAPAPFYPTCSELARNPAPNQSRRHHGHWACLSFSF